MGGQLELDATALAAADGSAPPVGGDHLFVASGRTAISLAASAVVAEAGRGPCLLPAYLCGSVIQPFRELGLPIELYRVDTNLRIVADDLAERVRRLRPACVLFVDYFGFPVDDAAAEALREARSVCRLIEDCAHGSLIECDPPAVGQTGDFALTSLRKFLPLPDGGLLVDRVGAGLVEPAPAESPVARRRLAAQLLRAEVLDSPDFGEDAEQVYLDLFAAAEAELDAAVPLASASRLSRGLLGALPLGELAERRRRNFIALLEGLRASPLASRVRPLFQTLPAGVSPLVFPVRVAAEARDAVRQALAERRVFCPVHWPLPPEVDPGRFADSARLSSEILGLPIDQRYGEDDMQVVLARLERAWAAAA